MKLVRFRSACLLVAAFWLAPARADHPVPGGPSPSAPELFKGEVDDVGPQFLLLAQEPRPRHLELWGNVEYSSTDNVTMVANDPTSSTLLVAQLGGAWHFAERPFLGGRLGVALGTEVQTYRYGFLANAGRPINFIEINRNNFDLAGGNLLVSWRRDGWLATAGLRHSLLKSRSSHRLFYRETVLEGQVVREWRLAPRLMLASGVETAARLTRTDSFGILPGGWNDRADLGLLGALECRLSRAWHAHLIARLLGSHYLSPGRHRDDIEGALRLTAARSLGEKAELTLDCGFERRVSSESLIPDYSRLDAGLGASARWWF